MSGWLDYPPGPLGWLGNAADSMFGGGGEDTADDMRNSDKFDYAWACGACNAPISDTDSVCPSCNEPVEWDQPPIG